MVAEPKRVYSEFLVKGYETLPVRSPLHLALDPITRDDRKNERPRTASSRQRRVSAHRLEDAYRRR